MKLLQRLHTPAKAGNIEPTTKLLEAIRTAFNRAFFVPKIHAQSERMGAKNRFRILCAGGLIALNTRPLCGNKGSRLRAVVETRPPVFYAGGQILTKLLGGQFHA